MLPRQFPVSAEPEYQDPAVIQFRLNDNPGTAERETGVSDAHDLDRAIARYTAGPFTDSTLLTDAGLVSLSMFRIAAELCPDPSAEINVEGLAGVRTIRELKQWLGGLLGNGAEVGGAAR